MPGYETDQGLRWKGVGEPPPAGRPNGSPGTSSSGEFLSGLGGVVDTWSSESRRNGRTKLVVQVKECFSLRKSVLCDTNWNESSLVHRARNLSFQSISGDAPPTF